MIRITTCEQYDYTGGSYHVKGYPVVLYLA